MKQKLYIGRKYNNGYDNKKIMIVGHQQHASEEEILRYRNNPELEFEYENNFNDLMQELIDGRCMNWDTTDRRSWLIFGRILTGDRTFSLGTEKSASLWESISFCNFLQIPDYNLVDRQGKDREEYYLQALTIFKEYLEEAKPNKVIVWGNYSFPYISSIGTPIDNDKCLITLASGEVVEVLKIPHPSRVPKGGYDSIIPFISKFINE